MHASSPPIDVPSSSSAQQQQQQQQQQHQPHFSPTNYSISMGGAGGLLARKRALIAAVAAKKETSGSDETRISVANEPRERDTLNDRKTTTGGDARASTKPVRSVSGEIGASARDISRLFAGTGGTSGGVGVCESERESDSSATSSTTAAHIRSLSRLRHSPPTRAEARRQRRRASSSSTKQENEAARRRSSSMNTKTVTGKSNGVSGASDSSMSSTRAQDEFSSLFTVDENAVSTLIGMGFSREEALLALSKFISVDHCVEWLVTMRHQNQERKKAGRKDPLSRSPDQPGISHTFKASGADGKRVAFVVEERKVFGTIERLMDFEFFERLLCSGMKETFQEEICIGEVSFDVFRVVIDFVERRRLPTPYVAPLDEELGVLAAADRFQMASLTQHVCEHLKQRRFTPVLEFVRVIDALLRHARASLTPFLLRLRLEYTLEAGLDAAIASDFEDVAVVLFRKMCVAPESQSSTSYGTVSTHHTDLGGGTTHMHVIGSDTSVIGVGGSSLSAAATNTSSSSSSTHTPNHNRLLEVARRGQADLLRVMLLNGYSRLVNARPSPLIAAIKHHRSSCASLLLEFGAATGCQRAVLGVSQLNDCCPLQVAVNEGNVTIVNLLLEHGADANFVHSDAMSLLELATARVHVSVVRALLEKGCDVTLRDSPIGGPSDSSGSSHAVRSRSMSQTSPSPSPPNVSHLSRLAASEVISSGSHVAASQSFSSSASSSPLAFLGAMHRAVVVESSEIVQLLLQYRASPSVLDRQGRTPLHRCTERLAAFHIGDKSSGACDFDQLVRIAKLLLQYGAPLHTRDNSPLASTPLSHLLNSRTRLSDVRRRVSRAALQRNERAAPSSSFDSTRRTATTTTVHESLSPRSARVKRALAGKSVAAHPIEFMSRHFLNDRAFVVSSGGHALALWAAEERHYELLRELVHHGAPLDGLLLRACADNHTEAVRFLLALNDTDAAGKSARAPLRVSPNERDVRTGFTPLHVCARHVPCHVRVNRSNDEPLADSSRHRSPQADGRRQSASPLHARSDVGVVAPVPLTTTASAGDSASVNVCSTCGREELCDSCERDEAQHSNEDHQGPTQGSPIMMPDGGGVDASRSVAGSTSDPPSVGQTIGSKVTSGIRDISRLHFLAPWLTRAASGLPSIVGGLGTSLSNTSASSAASSSSSSSSSASSPVVTAANGTSNESGTAASSSSSSSNAAPSKLDLGSATPLTVESFLTNVEFTSPLRHDTQQRTGAHSSSAPTSARGPSSSRSRDSSPARGWSRRFANEPPTYEFDVSPTYGESQAPEYAVSFESSGGGNFTSSTSSSSRCGTSSSSVMRVKIYGSAFGLIGSQTHGRGGGTAMTSVECVRLLCAAKADATRLDLLGNTPVHVCAAQGTADVLELLLESVDDVDARELVLNTPNKKGLMPLHLAVHSGDPMRVSVLVEAGADPHMPDSSGVTPLRLAYELETRAIQWGESSSVPAHLFSSMIDVMERSTEQCQVQ